MACPGHPYKRNRKEKNHAVLFPVLEEHLVEWVDRANEQHVVISDEVLRSATENSNRQGEKEGVFHIFQ